MYQTPKPKTLNPDKHKYATNKPSLSILTKVQLKANPSFKMAHGKKLNMSHIQLMHIWLIFVLLPILSSKSLPDPDHPESISFAADAIGMYLKKIANDELFVQKMQEIFDMDSISRLSKTKGVYCWVLSCIYYSYSAGIF